MGCHARRRRAARRQRMRDIALQQQRDLRWRRAKRGFAHQVVRKSRAVHQLRRAQFLHRIGEFERATAEQTRSKLDVERLGSHRRGARQSARERRNLFEALLDQGRQIVGQRGCVGPARHGARGEPGADGAQHEQGVASGAPRERVHPACGLPARQCECLHQQRDLGSVQRCQQHRRPLIECHGPLRPGPVRNQPAGATLRRQRQQQIDRSRIGELQVIDRDAGQPGAAPVIDRVAQRLAQPKRAEGVGRRSAQRGRQARQFGRGPRRCRRAEACRQCRQQRGKQRIRHGRITGTRVDCDPSGSGGHEVGKQAGLAYSRLALNAHRLTCLQRSRDVRQGAVAADEMGRTQQRQRQWRRRCGGRCAGLDLRRERLRLRSGGDADLACKQFVAAPVGRQRRRAVPAQVVQPHQPAVRVLDDRRLGDEPLGVRQRCGDAAGRLVLFGQCCQRLLQTPAPALARRTQPSGQIRVGVVGFDAGQQLAGCVVRVGTQAGLRLIDVVLQHVGQANRCVACDDVGAEGPLEAKDALAQADVGLPRCAVGPQQRRSARPLDRAFGGKQQQQQRVARGQRLLGPAGNRPARRAEQGDAPPPGWRLRR